MGNAVKHENVVSQATLPEQYSTCFKSCKKTRASLFDWLLLGRLQHPVDQLIYTRTSSTAHLDDDDTSKPAPAVDNICRTSAVKLGFLGYTVIPIYAAIAIFIGSKPIYYI